MVKYNHNGKLYQQQGSQQKITSQAPAESRPAPPLPLPPLPRLCLIVKCAWVGRTPVGVAGHIQAAAAGGSLEVADRTPVVADRTLVVADRTPVGADHSPVGAGGTLVRADKGEVFPKIKCNINLHH